MHKKITLICGESDLKPDFEAIGNNPNFVFENDPNFETLRLFDSAGNIVNVNSWIECANYINGGWTNYSSDFVNGEKYIFFVLCGLIVLGLFLQRKYSFLKKV